VTISACGRGVSLFIDFLCNERGTIKKGRNKDVLSHEGVRTVWPGS